MDQIKHIWISRFREQGDIVLQSLYGSNKSYKDKANLINKSIVTYRERIIDDVKRAEIRERWSNEEFLNEVLHITYASYIVMLEYRNMVWPYEYMAFARRIGELWEPFCKLTFEYSVNNLILITPPDFNEVQNGIQRNVIDYINSLPISIRDKEELIEMYNVPWSLVDSGGIQLALDLHFEQDGIKYNCDFKSGFSSNEKGNTNRLLLVASIYNSLSEYERTIIFVRQPEDQNNHYLQILKNSPYWDVYCADDAYAAMEHFTGFNLRRWLDENVDWANDISTEFRRHLEENDLLRYLTW